MALMSGREMLPTLLRVSGADHYSKQQVHVWSQHKVRYICFMGGQVIPEGARDGFGK